MNKPPQHSPGPWTYDRESVWDADNCYVCSWVTLGNASLIAAAPDMLRLLRVLVETHYSGEGGKQTWLVLNDALDETHKLIARLDGEQP